MISMLGVTAGCAAVTSLDGERMSMRSAAFASYVEAVFRRQNEVATELAFALDSAPFDSARYRQLEAAEAALLDACDGLNLIAERRRDGEGAGGLRAARAARKAPECERAALSAAGVLAADE
jgi:hypothetical protein